MVAAMQLVGQRFGKLKVTADKGRNKHGNRLWQCRCDCGKTVLTTSAQLSQGKTTSCGCNRIKWNLAGRRFGKLVAKERLPKPDEHDRRIWRCHCDCGRTVDVPTDHLVRGITVTCGCRDRGLNLEGMKFGRLTVLSLFTKKSAYGLRRWRCRCDCGRVVSVVGSYLVKGSTKSCGCLRRETGRLIGSRDYLKGKIIKRGPEAPDIDPPHEVADRVSHRLQIRSAEMIVEAIRLQGSDQRQEPPAISVGKADEAILLALLESHPLRLDLYALADATDISRRTIGPRLEALGDLLHRPTQRGGVGLSEKGLAVARALTSP